MCANRAGYTKKIQRANKATRNVASIPAMSNRDDAEGLLTALNNSWVDLKSKWLIGVKSY